MLLHLLHVVDAMHVWCCFVGCGWVIQQVSLHYASAQLVTVNGCRQRFLFV